MGMCRAESKEKWGLFLRPKILEDGTYSHFPSTVLSLSGLQLFTESTNLWEKSSEPHFFFFFFKLHFPLKYLGIVTWKISVNVSVNLLMCMKKSLSQRIYITSLSHLRDKGKKCDNRKLHLIIDQKRGFISDYSRDFFWSLKPPN